MIAITTGSKGSIVIKDGEIISSPAVKITPVDTNGAGDMYAGSFMHAYLQGYDLSTCAEFSNFASSKIVETFGPRFQVGVGSGGPPRRQEERPSGKGTNATKASLKRRRRKKTLILNMVHNILMECDVKSILCSVYYVTP